MTLKHTPGPWTIDGNTISGFVDRDMAPHYLAPVCCIDSDWCEPVQTANARLISAAPDMLAALQALTATARTFRDVPKREQEWTPIDDEALEAAFAAIAKATGE